MHIPERHLCGCQAPHMGEAGQALCLLRQSLRESLEVPTQGIAWWCVPGGAPGLSRSGSHNRRNTRPALPISLVADADGFCMLYLLALMLYLGSP